MDPLNSPLNGLVNGIPDWLKRLDELNGQIEQRQLDLARFSEDNLRSSTRSLKHRGSTESLKPGDDPAAYPSDPIPPPQDDITSTPARTNNDAQKTTQPPSSPGGESQTPSVRQRQRNDVVATAQRRVRATLKKRQKTDSMVSTEGAVPKYRSRSMVLVYYDSYVQSFFEELVKFVSASRNMMRKAKMAAKVAQIKRLAELEMHEDEDQRQEGAFNPGDALIAADPFLASKQPNKGGPEEIQLHTVGTHELGLTPRMGGSGYFYSSMANRRPGAASSPYSRSGMGLFNQDGPDVYDDLDKGLEFVQSMCERAAHQFLRDGECGDEIEKVKQRLGETKEIADKEVERVHIEYPNGLAPPEPPKIRSYRPMSMRRDAGASNNHSKKTKRLEVDDDEGVQDMDGAKPAHPI
ncbi:hypothetical protein PG996_010423 [Apiospora saccharicola]|uniref:Uncharacterized protein n=1 Tax=Apiospora saccharicola TaxID=335842 RepID=A0ABR1UNI7_9PEZI